MFHGNLGWWGGLGFGLNLSYQMSLVKQLEILVLVKPQRFFKTRVCLV